MSALAATASLLLFVASVLSVATIIFAPFFLGAFLLALGGVIGGVKHGEMPERRPPMDARGWRHGS